MINDTNEHVLVGLSSSPSNEKIVKTAAKMAKAFNAKFTALYVKTTKDDKMSLDDKTRLKSNISLAESLGAIVVTIYGDDISFQINPGEKVAFVGSSGSGKTTMVKLLMKFYSAQSGNIYINDFSISEIDTKSYRKKIAYVPQDVMLFSGTIAENITLGSEGATFEEIIEVSKKTIVSYLISAFGVLGSLLSGFISGSIIKILCQSRFNFVIFSRGKNVITIPLFSI